MAAVEFESAFHQLHGKADSAVTKALRRDYIVQQALWWSLIKNMTNPGAEDHIATEAKALFGDVAAEEAATEPQRGAATEEVAAEETAAEEAAEEGAAEEEAATQEAAEEEAAEEDAATEAPADEHDAGALG